MDQPLRIVCQYKLSLPPAIVGLTCSATWGPSYVKVAFGVQAALNGFVKIVFRPFSTTVLLAVGHNSDDEFVRALAGLTDGFERLSSGVIQRRRTPRSI